MSNVKYRTVTLSSSPQRLVLAQIPLDVETWIQIEVFSRENVMENFCIKKLRFSREELAVLLKENAE